MNDEAADQDQDWNDPSRQNSGDTYEMNREILDTIDMLERALPSIEDPSGIFIALFDMYNEIEEMERAGDYLVKAAEQILKGKHLDLTYFLYNQLELFAQLNMKAQKVYEQLADLISEEEDEELGAHTLHIDQRKIYQHDLVPELLLARHLQRSRILSDAEYHVVLHDLCWYSIHPPTAPRTLLYVLEDRTLPHHDRAIEFLAHDSRVPFIDLRRMNPDAEALERLPHEFMRVRGACPFGFVGGELMVAVLNPFNLQLRDDVAQQIQLPAHYYLTSAVGYQKILDLL